MEFLKHLQAIQNNVICLNKSTLLLWKPVAVPLSLAPGHSLLIAQFFLFSVLDGAPSKAHTVSVRLQRIPRTLWNFSLEAKGYVKHSLGEGAEGSQREKVGAP